MAEILLARLVGPSGFERPVVIKRIRRDLDRKELAALFIDEARIAAKVRHANVVAVEDLGTDEGAPYLVMEYLEGESLSNLERRLKSRDERTPFGLTAYIIAEACAGLHAAHELRDSEGELVGLVHRDVSPQNVFVTYGGAVKVVDFGIAGTKATEAPGPVALRGKFAYMAPEQLKNDPAAPVDRRTDVFALGVVLYELLTGHTLFKRFNARATMRAVMSDPIVPVRRVEPAVPAELEAICMRALARSLEERYANAAEMRRELLVAMRVLASEEPSAELAELMVKSFPDRIDEKQVLLRRVREGSIVDRIPVGDVDITVSIPGIDTLGDWTGVAVELPTSRVASGLPPALLSDEVATVPGVSSASVKLIAPKLPVIDSTGQPVRARAPVATSSPVTLLADPPSHGARGKMLARWGGVVALTLGGVGLGFLALTLSRGARGAPLARAPASAEVVAPSTSASVSASASGASRNVTTPADMSGIVGASPAEAPATGLAGTPPADDPAQSSAAPPTSGSRGPAFRRGKPAKPSVPEGAPAPSADPPKGAPSSTQRGFRRFQ
jgi:serine/threonine-protein kinase